MSPAVKPAGSAQRIAVGRPASPGFSPVGMPAVLHSQVQDDPERGPGLNRRYRIAESAFTYGTVTGLASSDPPGTRARGSMAPHQLIVVHVQASVCSTLVGDQWSNGGKKSPVLSQHRTGSVTSIFRKNSATVATHAQQKGSDDAHPWSRRRVLRGSASPAPPCCVRPGHGLNLGCHGPAGPGCSGESLRGQRRQAMHPFEANDRRDWHLCHGDDPASPWERMQRRNTNMSGPCCMLD